MIEPDDDPRSPCGLHLFTTGPVPRRCPWCESARADLALFTPDAGKTFGGNERKRAPTTKPVPPPPSDAARKGHAGKIRPRAKRLPPAAFVRGNVG